MKEQRRPDKRDEAIERISPKRLRSALAKTKMITMWASEDDKESMMQAAKKYRLALTECILSLHYLADKKFKWSQS